MKNLTDVAENESIPSSWGNDFAQYVTDKIKDKKRKEEIRSEAEKIFQSYIKSFHEENPAIKRASNLERTVDMISEETDKENSKRALEQRLYSEPGRQYHYVNATLGTEKKKSSEIKEELLRAGKYAIKEGWPVGAAGAGWWWLNSNYGAAGTAAKIAAAKVGRWTAAKAAYGSSPLAYANPFTFGPVRLAKDTAKALTGLATGYDTGAVAGALTKGAVWSRIATPLAWGIGLWAAYKTINYFIKRRKEKKIEAEELERLEGIRNHLMVQNQSLAEQIRNFDSNKYSPAQA